MPPHLKPILGLCYIFQSDMVVTSLVVNVQVCMNVIHDRCILSPMVLVQAYIIILFRP